MFKKNLFLVFEEINTLKVSKWNKLIKDLNKESFKTSIFSKNKIPNLNIVSLNKKIGLKYLILFIFEITILKEKKIEYLKNHPELKKGILKLVPTFIKYLYIKYLFIRIEKILLKHLVTDILIMEPKDFLYSTFIIIVEFICKKHKINFNVIHASFLINNINFYNSLTRQDKDLEIIFKNNFKLKPSKKTFFELELIKRFDHVSSHKNSGQIDIPLNFFNKNKNLEKKIAVISLSKESNYREFYFLENTKEFSLLKIIKILNNNNYNVIIRKHPKSGMSYSHILNVSTSKLSLFKLSNIIDIDLHISSSSHSFFDAISLNIPILIWTKKNLYSMKTLFPSLCISDFENFNNFLLNINKINYQKEYNYFKNVLNYYMSLKKYKINFNYTLIQDNSKYLSNMIRDYYLK